MPEKEAKMGACFKKIVPINGSNFKGHEVGRGLIPISEILIKSHCPNAQKLWS